MRKIFDFGIQQNASLVLCQKVVYSDEFLRRVPAYLVCQSSPRRMQWLKSMSTGNSAIFSLLVCQQSFHLRKFVWFFLFQGVCGRRASTESGGHTSDCQSDRHLSLGIDFQHVSFSNLIGSTKHVSMSLYLCNNSISCSLQHFQVSAGCWEAERSQCIHFHQTPIPFRSFEKQRDFSQNHLENVLLLGKTLLFTCTFSCDSKTIVILACH